MVKKSQQYYEGVGRRKTAIARVRVIESKKEAGITVNDKKAVDYFCSEELLSAVSAPLRAVGKEETTLITVKVEGGGLHGQAEAVRMGISRALVKLEGDSHKVLRDLDYLKRDPRKKERKKPGLKKARRAPQWAKR